MKRIISLSLVVLCLFAFASCGKKEDGKNIVDFNFNMSKDEVAQLRSGDEKAEVETSDTISYTRKDIGFFKDEDVTVLYTFGDDSGKLIRTKYDVSKCSEENINKMIKYLDENYSPINIGDTPLENTYIKKWENDEMTVTYMRIDEGVSRMGFTFENKGDTQDAN